MAKTKQAEAEVEAGSETRVGPMHEAFAAFIKAETGVDISAEQVFAVTSKRVAFRKSEAYLNDVKAAKAEAKAALEATKAERAAAREAAAAEKAAAKEAKATERETAKAEREKAAAEKAEAKAAAAAEKAASKESKPAKGKKTSADALAEADVAVGGKKGKATAKTKAPF